MIKKYLVVGRQIFISSKKQEGKDEKIRELEILMPIETFWKIEKMLKEADYLIATGNEKVSVQETYKKIITAVAPYAVSEKDRVWLYDKAKSK